MEDNLQLIYLHSTMLQDIVQEIMQNNEDISPLSDTLSLATTLG
jgi:hypothetical protein